MGANAARLVLGLMLAAFAVSLARGEVQSSGIMVSTNSEGETQVVIFKPNITETDIMTYVSSVMSPFLNPPNHRLYRSLTESSNHNINPATDPIVLLAPTVRDGVADDDDVEDFYVAYVLPKGLSSLPNDLKTQLLAANEGMEKTALILFPRDVDAIGATKNVPSNKLFPLDRIKISEVKVVEGDSKVVKVESIMDTLGYIRLSYKGTPWLILRDVNSKVEVVNDEEVVPKCENVVKNKESVLSKFGKISLAADGNIAWNLLSLTPPVPLVPQPPISIPEYPIYPFYFPGSFLNPLPYWYLNPPHFFWPVGSSSKKK